MLRVLGRRPNPLRSTAACTPADLCVSLAAVLSVAVAMPLACAAQQPDPLPSAPQPKLPLSISLAQAGPPVLVEDPQRGGIGRKSTDMSPVGHEPNDAPIVAMAPHPDGQLWWISGQANIIIQGDLPFHSPYQGKNSFIPRGEYKTSML